MGEHYFTPDPTSESKPASATWQQSGISLEFRTDSGVFSRGAIDYGSHVLLTSLPPLQGRVLDLGCGYGFLGIALKRLHPELDVIMGDINRRALDLARYNAQNLHAGVEILESDGFANIFGLFSAIITNPPIRAGKAVYYRWFEEAPAYLVEGGRLFIVMQKKHGAPSARDFLKTLYSDVQVLSHSAGYHVIQATK